MTKRWLAAALAAALFPQEALAVVVSRAPSVVPARVGAIPRVNGLPGGVISLAQSAPGRVAAFQDALTQRAVFSPVPDASPVPVLPDSVLAVNGPVADAVPADAVPADASPVDSQSLLRVSAARLEDAPTPSAKAWTLERLFTGARSLLGLGEGPAVVAPVALTAGGASVLSPFQTVAPRAGRAVPPVPLALQSRGLNPGEILLSAPADAPKAAAPAPAEAPKGDDWINWTAIKWMMTQRTISTAAFILTSIAYPMVVIPALGPLEFGALMALGPIAALALGPVNGLIAGRMHDPRKGLALMAGLRAVLAAVLPVLALTGNVTFVPLLIASIANSWQFSLLMTSENGFMAKYAGRKHLGTLTTLGFTSYFTLQVALGTLLLIGSYIDAWNPMIPFWISAAVHAGLVVLILWKIPAVSADAATLAKRAAAQAEKAALSAVDRLKAFGAKAAAFFKKFRLESALFAASIALYVYGVPLVLPLIGAISAGSPLWISAALLFWVTRSTPFKTVWARGPIRNAILLAALAAGLFYPFQNLILPLVATALGAKALIYGQLLGAFFFGQLLSNAAKASGLPVVGGKPLEFWIRHLVVAMGAAWAALRLFAGDPTTMILAGVGAAALGYGLITLARRLTDRGWIRFLGVGLAGSAGVALFWGSYPAIFASVMLMGLFLGPFLSAINGYISQNSKNEERAMNFGVSSSLFNAATSVGYALVTLNNDLSGGVYPGSLWPVVAAFLAAGVIFFFAPRWLPGLPDKSVSSAEKK